MSWSMYMGVVGETNGTYFKIMDDKELYALKCLCDYRETLNDDFETENLPEDISKEMGQFFVWDYVKSVKKDSIDMSKLKPIDREGYLDSYTWADDVDQAYKDEILNLTEPDIREHIKPENKGKYLSIMEKVPRSHRGSFYSYKTFRDALKKYQEEYNKAIIKKEKWNRIENSLKYQALDTEKKENIMSEYSYIDEEIETADAKVEACEYVLGILDYLSDYDVDTYAYIYGE